MNLRSLRTESPSWPTIQQFAEGSSAVIEALLEVVDAYDPFDPQADLDAEWEVIHALRILSHRLDPRLLPIAVRLLVLFDEDEDGDLIIVNELSMVLEMYRRPEYFEVFWELFERYAETETADELLSAAAECKSPTPALRKMMEEWFRDDPTYAAGAMLASADCYYLPILEARLRWLAPFVKYVPFDRFGVSEHGEWVEVGGAWCELKRVQSGQSPWKNTDWTLDRYYLERPSLSAKEKEASLKESLVQVNEEKRMLWETFLSELPEVRARTAKDLLSRTDASPDIRDAMIDDYLLQSEPAFAGAKIGRNEACPCGSGKKFKKCCVDRGLKRA